MFWHCSICSTSLIIDTSPGVMSTVAVLAEVSLMSPRNVFIFIIKKNICKIKISTKKRFSFEKNFTGNVYPNHPWVLQHWMLQLTSSMCSNHNVSTFHLTTFDNTMPGHLHFWLPQCSLFHAYTRVFCCRRWGCASLHCNDSIGSACEVNTDLLPRESWCWKAISCCINGQ